MLERLRQVIEERAAAGPAMSYTAKLVANPPYAARKFGEEAVELVVAALAQDRTETVSEAADVVFHLLVLLHTRDIQWGEVEAELTRREGMSGLAEKASRKES